MPPSKTSSFKNGLFSIALTCVLLLVSSILKAPSVAHARSANSERPITSPGRLKSEARQTLASAELLFASWNKSSLREAILKYDKAALNWRAARDFSNAARATLRCGEVYFILSEYQHALDRYQKAVALAEKASDRLTKIRALSQMGRVYSYMAHNDLAQKHLTTALDLFEPGEVDRDALARNAHGDVLSNLAEVNYSKGYLPKSSEQLERARKELHDDRDGEAKVLLFASYIAGSLGDSEKAFSQLSEALALYRAGNNKRGEGLALTALGLWHSVKGKQDEAIELNRQAIEIFRSVGDRNSEAIASNAFGQAYEFLGEFSLARANYLEALRLFQDTGALDMAAATMFKIGHIHRLMGKADEALVYLEGCLRASRAAKKFRTEINTLNEIATIHAIQGRQQEALKHHQRIQQFYKMIDDRRGQALALNNQGDFLLGLGQKRAALDAYNRALRLSETSSDSTILLSTLYNISRVHNQLGHLDDALSHINRSLRLIEELRQNVGSPDFRATYFSAVEKHYDLGIDILMQLERARPGEGFATAALLLSEKSRARSLIDLLAESPGALRQGVSKELVDRERELAGLLRSLAQYEWDLSLTKTDANESAEVAAQMTQLRSEYQQVQTQLRKQNSHLSSLAQALPLDLKQIQNQLPDSETLLLEYALGDERSYLWAVTSNSLQIYELPPRKTIEDAAREVYALLTSRQGSDGRIENNYQANVEASDKLYRGQASRLSQILLGPVASQLGTRRLVVVTEGALQYIPFGALPAPADSEKFLVETNEIVVWPSISTLIAIRADKEQAHADKIVTVIADPVFGPNDDRVQNGKASPQIASAASSRNPMPWTFEGLRDRGPARLTHASEEADAIAAAAPRGTAMVVRGFDASRETAMSSHVGEYQIVHFATHGFLDTEHPELSGIVLSMVDRDGLVKNGLMPLYDIYTLDLSAELTVLSACQTGLGKDVKGEGLVGLTHSFLSAGSKSVVASLWKVDDRATAVLMADFYESMLQKGLTPAAALRAAKLKMMKEKQWSAPYYWAGFVLQGEYANHIAVQQRSWVRSGLMILLLLVLIAPALIVVRRLKRPQASAPPA